MVEKRELGRSRSADTRFVGQGSAQKIEHRPVAVGAQKFENLYHVHVHVIVDDAVAQVDHRVPGGEGRGASDSCGINGTPSDRR